MIDVTRSIESRSRDTGFDSPLLRRRRRRVAEKLARSRHGPFLVILFVVREYYLDVPRWSQVDTDDETRREPAGRRKESFSRLSLSRRERLSALRATYARRMS